MTVTVVKMSFNFCFGDVGMFAIENTTFFKLDAGCPESPKTVWHCFPCSQDLKCSVISLICLHFQIKPVWCADWDACDVLFSMKTQLLDIIDKLRICINDLYIYIYVYIYIHTEAPDLNAKIDAIYAIGADCKKNTTNVLQPRILEFGCLVRSVSWHGFHAF